MTRPEITEAILAAKQAKGLSYQAIADAVGRNVVWTTAALLGHAVMDEAEATKVVELLEVGWDVGFALQQREGTPTEMPPTDPLIYRFHEIVQEYGGTLRELIREQFGDGIMSAIDFTMNIERVPNPKGDRVRVTMEGKFLPYVKW
ncbi:MAG TPA: cyanase [Isosphaeraceae bacterium]|jgi:cyanate lyase|nr:cyanase [Isosphaeraceae bacterium]